jgi:hypothetical protein
MEQNALEVWLRVQYTDKPQNDGSSIQVPPPAPRTGPAQHTVAPCADPRTGRPDTASVRPHPHSMQQRPLPCQPAHGAHGALRGLQSLACRGPSTRCSVRVVLERFEAHMSDHAKPFGPGTVEVSPR